MVLKYNGRDEQSGKKHATSSAFNTVIPQVNEYTKREIELICYRLMRGFTIQGICNKML
jgi:hypothetical protein